jgi:hypothetical protein
MPEDQHEGRDDGGAEGEQHALQPDIEARSSTQGRHQDHRRGKEKHVDPVGRVRYARPATTESATATVAVSKA